MKPALTVNTHTSNIKCLDLFFKYMNKYVGRDYFSNVYLFIDPCDVEYDDVTKVEYDPNVSFTEQMRFCLSKVEDEVLLYSNEDYIFYDWMDKRKADKLLSFLIASPDLSFVKFLHMDSDCVSYGDNMYLVDKNHPCNYSQTLSFWKTADLLNVYMNCPHGEIGAKGNTHGHAEVMAQDVCRDLNIAGVSVYNGERKRGKYHYDTSIFPHIASALIKGEWNTQEYPELFTILVKEGII